jgi:hypothetical protein
MPWFHPASKRIYHLEIAAVLGIEDTVHRMWVNFVARPSGPLGLRFLLQPAMSTLIAIRDGFKDARTGRSPFLWTILTNKSKRDGHLREGLAATSKIIVLAFLLDVAYQVIEFETFHLGEATIVAIVVAFVPYLIFRGPVARIVRYWRSRAPPAGPGSSVGNKG